MSEHTTTKDEALRVAREALEEIELALCTARPAIPTAAYGLVQDSINTARSALRTIALAVEAPSDAVQSVALGDPKALAADEETVRAAIYAAQLTPNRDMDAYEALARLVTRASSSGAVGETAGKARAVLAMDPAADRERILAIAHRTASRYRHKGAPDVPPVYEFLPHHLMDFVEKVRRASLPGTSNGQEIGNGTDMQKIERLLESIRVNAEGALAHMNDWRHVHLSLTMVAEEAVQAQAALYRTPCVQEVSTATTRDLQEKQ